MDVLLIVLSGRFSDVDDIKDPGENLMEISVGSVIGVGTSVGGGNNDNVLYLELIDANDQRYTIHPEDSSARLQPRHTYWFADFLIDQNAAQGTWLAQVVVDDNVQEVAVFNVTPEDQNVFQELQVEDQSWQNANVESNHSGFTGTGFVNTENTSGTWVDLNVTVPLAGTYQISVRYANGANDDRSQQILVNGQQQVANQSFASTGAWSSWADSEFSVTLEQGDNTIRLVSSTSSGAANLDRFTVAN